MVIFGDPFIPSEKFYEIQTIEDTKQTPANSIVSFSYDKEMMHYCFVNEIRYVVSISELFQAVIANNLKASFILLSQDLLSFQKVAENYLFDTKVLIEIASEKQINSLAKDGIDAVVYPSNFQKVRS